MLFLGWVQEFPLLLIQDSLLVKPLENCADVRLGEVIFQVKWGMDAVEHGSERVGADVMQHPADTRKVLPVFVRVEQFGCPALVHVGPTMTMTWRYLHGRFPTDNVVCENFGSYYIPAYTTFYKIYIMNEMSAFSL